MKQPTASWKTRLIQGLVGFSIGYIALYIMVHYLIPMRPDGDIQAYWESLSVTQKVPLALGSLVEILGFFTVLSAVPLFFKSGAANQN